MPKRMRKSYSPEVLAEYSRGMMLFGISMMVFAACLIPGMIWLPDIKSGIRWPVYICAFIWCLAVVPGVYAFVHYSRFRRLLREQRTADAGQSTA